MDAYARAGQLGKAAVVAEEILAEIRAETPLDNLQLAEQLHFTEFIFFDVKAWKQAEPFLRECLSIREKIEPDIWTTYYTRSMLGAALLGQQKTAEAEPLLRSGFEGMRQRADKIPPQSRDRLAQALDRHIALAEATGKPDEAAKWREEKAKLDAEPTPKLGPKTPGSIAENRPPAGGLSHPPHRHKVGLRLEATLGRLRSRRVG